MTVQIGQAKQRELSGVFEACSDGAMNIVPHAYSSSGKQFPAQVKFVQIWQCYPLSEKEFRDAIRENYFSSHKFNFGLSERQVEKLLLLFSKKKIKDRPLERQFTRSKVPRSVGYSSKEARSATGDAGDGGFIMIGSKKDERNADATFGSAISSEYLGDSISKHRREDDRYPSSTFRNRHKTDRVLISNEQFVDSFSKVGGLVDDGRAVTSNMVGNDHDMDIEFRTAVLTNHCGHSFPTSRRSSDDVNFATSYGLGHELNEDSGFQLPSTKHPGWFQSNPPLHFSKLISEENSVMSDRFQQSSATCHLEELQNSLYCGQPILEEIKDQFQLSSTAPHSMEQQNSELSFSALDGDRLPMSNAFYSTSYGDGVVACNIPYDPDACRLGNRCSSSLSLSNSVPELPAFQNNVFPSSDQSFPPHVEPEGISRHPNINASLFDYIQLSYANQHEHLNRSGMLFPDADYPDHVVRNPCMNEKTGHNRRSPSFEICNPVPQYPPHNTFPSFVNESFTSHIEPKSTNKCRHINSSLSGDSPFSYLARHDHANSTGMLLPGAAYPENVLRNSSGIEGKRENTSSSSFSLNRSSSFVSDVRYSVSSQEERDHQMSQHEHNKAFAASVPRLERVSIGHVDCHENGSVNLDTRENSERIYSDCQKRKSVFSRLGLPSDVRKQDEHDMDSSVDEVMTMLHQSHNQWVKEKHFEQQMKRHDEVTNFKNKKQMTTNSKLLMDHLPKVSKEIMMNDISAVKEDGLQISEVIPFVDFQRRRNLQKIQSDSNTGDFNGSTETTGFSGQQQKRRKLIRPKFSENGSSGNVIIGSHDNGSRMTQNVELPEVTVLIGLEDKNIGFQGCSNYEGKEKVESRVVSSSDANADGDSKEALQHVVLVSHEYKSDVENSLSLTNSEFDRLPRHYGNSNHYLLQDSFSKSCDVKSENGIAKHGLDHNTCNGDLSDTVGAKNRSCHGGNEKLSKNVDNASCPAIGEVAIERMASRGMHYNRGSEKAAEEVGNGEENKQQPFLQSVGKPCKASSETVSCSNMKESEEICEEYDKRGEVMVAAAGKGLKVNFERENSGKENHVCLGHCEMTMGNHRSQASRA
ncbi:unnamed protein product [Dovyalis caffra]|uniref:DCD domain-containing protein n=1 Tax=Dovyalis caffra TaxID=77055 RepID=A0AAV1RJT4_9ROSI|nr:unnamed protein product [Dovyalis caffra]